MGVLVRPVAEHNNSDDEDGPATDIDIIESHANSNHRNHSALPSRYYIGLQLDIKDSAGVWSEAGNNILLYDV